MTLEPFIVSYSHALLEFADEKGELDAVRDAAELVIKILREETRLRLFLESPRIDRASKLSAIDAAFKGKVAETFYRFVRLVTSKGRIASLGEILEQFLVDHDAHLGRVNVSVTTAVPLEETQTKSLVDTLEKKLDKTVRLSPNVDESILGGMVVRFDGMVADSSLRTSLEEVTDRWLSLKLGSEFVHED